MQSIPSPSPAVEFRNLTGGYRSEDPPFHEATFRLAGPGVTHLVGPNGSGKSTFAELTSGYLRPRSGRCLIDGFAADSEAARDRRQVCRTQPALHPNLSIGDHLTIVRRLTGSARGPLDDRAERLGLTRWSGTRVSELSTGTIRKLWYLVCTAGPASVTILDEPFNGVDQESAATMIEEIQAWATRQLIVLICHDLPDGCRVDDTWAIARGTVSPLP